MPLTRPFLATSLQALTRSALLSLGMEHTLIDFFALAAVGAATVLLAILGAGLAIPRRQWVAISRRPPLESSSSDTTPDLALHRIPESTPCPNRTNSRTLTPPRLRRL